MTLRGLALAVLVAAVAAEGQAATPLFDAHLHYNGPEGSGLEPGEAAAALERHGVERAVVTGMPPAQAAALYRRAPGRVVPFLGVYEEPGDKGRWHQDPALPGRVAAALERGPWQGIGELHLFAPQRRSPVFLALVELAAERDLPLQVHADPAVIDALFEHAPGATVIWAHAGAYPFPPLVRDYLERYPGLYVDLSMRSGRVAPGGVLDPAWELLLMERPGRFLVGADTFSAGRWRRLGEVTGTIRDWLGQLPPGVAERLAWGNAAALFGEASLGGEARSVRPGGP